MLEKTSNHYLKNGGLHTIPERSIDEPPSNGFDFTPCLLSSVSESKRIKLTKPNKLLFDIEYVSEEDLSTVPK